MDKLENVIVNNNNTDRNVTSVEPMSSTTQKRIQVIKFLCEIYETKVECKGKLL